MSKNKTIQKLRKGARGGTTANERETTAFCKTIAKRDVFCWSCSLRVVRV